MAPEHVPHQAEQRSDTREWRDSDFPSLEFLERWLASHGLNAPHHQALPREADTYQHAGYKAVLCRVCQQPTIVGAESSDVSCGRPDCDVGLLSSVPSGDGH